MLRMWNQLNTCHMLFVMTAVGAWNSDPEDQQEEDHRQHKETKISVCKTKLTTAI